VAVWVEGFKEGIARHLGDLEAMAKENALECEILRDEPHRGLWEEIRDFGADATSVVYRLTVPLASVAQVVTTLDQWGSEAGTPIIVHPGSGTIWLSHDPGAPAGSWFPKLIALAREHGGHALMAAAPPAFKEGIDVWGPPPPSLALMRAIKRQLDPQGLLNPGRFVAGI